MEHLILVHKVRCFICYFTKFSPTSVKYYRPAYIQSTLERGQKSNSRGKFTPKRYELQVLISNC
jgi:hypothetical protein